MANVEVLTLEEIEALGSSLPRDLRSVGGSRNLVESWGKLDAGILNEGASVAMAPTTTSVVSIDDLRYSHHRVAQLLAAGVRETTVARLTGYASSSIANLKASPAFQELLAHYHDQVQEQFSDFVESAGGLSVEMVEELASRLRTDPKQFTVAQILESVKTLADRSGNAPVTKSLSVTANLDLGTKLAEARKRALAAMVPVLPSEAAE